MNQKRKETISEYLKIIANKEGVTESDIRNEIALAVSLALKSSDPKVQNFWKDVPRKGETLTIEEIIEYIATKISAQK